MSMLTEVLLRYRTEGHVRFDIPAALCQPGTANRLAAELQAIEGVYRVDVSRRHRKLSIRYMPILLDFRRLIAAMGAAVKSLEASPPAKATQTGLFSLRSAPWLQRLGSSRPLRWIKEKSQEVRETATAMKIVVRRGIGRSTEQLESGELLITFLNDVLVFYLIKVHWNLIVRYWLRRPLEYRYQWLASFYLMYLLIRSRQARLR